MSIKAMSERGAEKARLMRSHLCGPDAVEPRFSSLVEALRARACMGGNWLHFHKGKDEPVSLGGAQAWALARGWARALNDEGVQGGDRVGVLQPNAPDFIGAYFGTLLLGATPVPLPWPVMEGAPERTRDDTAAVMQRARLKALAAPQTMLGAQWGVPVVTTAASELWAEAVPDPQAPAFIQFTSGSTGSPRGAMLSHRAALTSALAMGRQLELSEGDRGVSWIPFFHDMGLVGVVLCSLVSNFEVHVLRPAEFLLRPSRWFELCSKVRATITVGPNFGYELAVRRGGAATGLDLSAIRWALNGSEPVHRSTLDAVQRALGPAGLREGAMTPVYGLAEATLGVCFATKPSGDFRWQGRDVVSVGAPLQGVEVRLERDGQAVSEGCEGEICVRGPMLMNGYFDDEIATAAALREGWLHTGDLGIVNGTQLHVTGREKELVIKAGRKFHPYDIERVVADAVDSTPNGVAAFSTPDASAGSEALVVVVELRRLSAASEAEATIRARLMDRLGVRADHIELVAAGALPRTTSGKVKRRECALRYGGQA